MSPRTRLIVPDKQEMNFMETFVTYDEVCNAAYKFFDACGGRRKLEELTGNMTMMERATFVQALSARLDYTTFCIFHAKQTQTTN